MIGGALLPSAIAYRLHLRRARPFFGQAFHVPAGTPVDRRLVFGALLFGIGGGLVGLCPGPALAALVTLRAPVLLFVVVMLAGLGLHRWWHPPR